MGFFDKLKKTVSEFVEDFIGSDDEKDDDAAIAELEKKFGLDKLQEQIKKIKTADPSEIMESSKDLLEAFNSAAAQTKALYGDLLPEETSSSRSHQEDDNDDYDYEEEDDNNDYDYEDDDDNDDYEDDDHTSRGRSSSSSRSNSSSRSSKNDEKEEERQRKAEEKARKAEEKLEREKEIAKIDKEIERLQDALEDCKAHIKDWSKNKGSEQAVRDEKAYAKRINQDIKDLKAEKAKIKAKK